MTLKQFFALTAILFLTHYDCPAQKVEQVARPKEMELPVAMGGDQLTSVRFEISKDKDYALCYTDREARVWKIPSGELIFRYQVKNSAARNGTAAAYLSKLAMTADAKYICVYENKLVMASDAVTGELVPNSLLFDSLASGDYDARRGYYGMKRLPAAVYAVPSSPLWVKRDYKQKQSEAIEIRASVSDPLHPGKQILIYEQQYCGSNDWIKHTLKKDVGDLRKKQEKSNHCQYQDLRVARYDPSSGTAEQLGALLPGVEDVDYPRVSRILAAPYDEAVVVSFYGSDPPKVINYRGEILWKMSATLNNVPTGFDVEGNLLAVENNPSGKIIRTFDIGSGTILKEYQMPAELPDLKILDRWGLTASVKKNQYNNFMIGLYSMKDGSLSTALTDEEAALKYSNAYKQEANQYYLALQEAERRRAIAYEQSMLEQKRKKEIIDKNNMERAREHARLWKVCDVCNGQGYTSKSGYSQGTTRTTEGTRQNTITGEKSTVRETVTTGAGAYTNYSSCSRCRGKGEVLR